MKKSILILSLINFSILFLVLRTSAQNAIPNADFENWTSGVPDQWDTSNGDILGTEFICVTRETADPQNGNSAAKIQTVSHNIIFVGEIIMPGIMTLGDVVIDILNQTGTVTGGVPVADYPKYLRGYYKYQPATGDSSVIGLGLTKWNGTSRDTIAFAYNKFGGIVANWEEFTVEVQYMNFIQPDSMNIMFVSSNIETGEAIAGSTLWVDNLWLEYSGVAVQAPALNGDLYVYPANNGQSLVVNTGNIEVNAVEVYSINGAMVKNINKISSVQSLINISELSNGMYILKVIYREGSPKTIKFTVI